MRAEGALLDRASDVIAGIDEIPSPLPPTPGNIETRMAQSRKSGAQLFVADSVSLWQRAAQAGIAGTVKNLGVLDWATLANLEEGVFATAADFVRVPDDWGSAAMPFPTGTLVDMALDAVIEGIADAIADAGIQVATSVTKAIPLAGAIIGGIIDLGRGLGGAIAAQRAADMPSFYKPAIFNPQVDVDVFRDFGGSAIRTGDWTEVFQPPGFMAMIGTLAPFSRALEDDGTVTLGPREPYGGGMIPGSVNLHAAIDVLPGGRVRDLGEFLPTLRKQAWWVWQGFIAQPYQPALYSVVTRHLAADWAGYMTMLRRWLDGDFSNDPTERVEFPKRKDCINALGSSRCDGRAGLVFSPGDRSAVIDYLAHPSRFGWAREDGSFIGERGQVVGHAKADDQFGVHREGVDVDPDTGSFGNPYRAAAWLRDRQFKTLDTLTVAYVDRSYAALDQDADPELYQRWQTRRTQLLQHQDRCLVDLDNVLTGDDGGIWLEQLRDSGVGTVRCSPMDLAIVGKAIPGIEDPPEQAGLDALRRSVRKAKKTGNGGLGLVAAVALGLMAWKAA